MFTFEIVDGHFHVEKPNGDVIVLTEDDFNKRFRIIGGQTLMPMNPRSACCGVEMQVGRVTGDSNRYCSSCGSSWVPNY